MGTQEERRRFSFITRWSVRKLGVVVVVLSVAQGFGAAYYNTELSRENSCQTAINKQFLEILKERATTGNENIQNVNTLIEQVFTSTDPTQAKAAYQKYLTELKKVESEIQQETYPAVGSCG